MDRKEHEIDAKITNLLWETAKILNPNSYLEPDMIQKAKVEVIKILKIKE